MKFDKMFPNVHLNEEPAPGIFKSNNFGPCLVCGDLTRWIDLNAQAYFCSIEHQKEYDPKPSDEEDIWN